MVDRSFKAGLGRGNRRRSPGGNRGWDRGTQRVPEPLPTLSRHAVTGNTPDS